MQKGSAIIPILITIGVLVIVGVAGAWYTRIIEIPGFPPPGCYYQQVQCIQAPCNPILTCGTVSSNPVVTSQATPSPSPTVSSALTGAENSPVPTDTGETASWKTYTSEKYAFSFKYPADWVVEPAKVGFEFTAHTADAQFYTSGLGGQSSGMDFRVVIEDDPAKVWNMPATSKQDDTILPASLTGKGLAYRGAAYSNAGAQVAISGKAISFICFDFPDIDPKDTAEPCAQFLKLILRTLIY